MDKQKALKKIAKCLELGNSANVNEAASAIKMAHNLMLKYGLEKDDIEFIKMGKTQSTHLLPTAISSTVLRVIRGINTKFGVEAVLTKHKGLNRVEFIGEADRAIFGAFAFDIIYRGLNEQAGQFRNSFSGTGVKSNEVSRRVNSFVSGWVEGALEKLPTISPDSDSNNKINHYIDKEFKNLDRETFKKQLREAMKNLTDDYEVGLKKGRKMSVNRPVEGTKSPKLIR